MLVEDVCWVKDGLMYGLVCMFVRVKGGYHFWCYHKNCEAVRNSLHVRQSVNDVFVLVDHISMLHG